MVDRTSRRLFRLAARLSGSELDAQDILQESSIRAYRALATRGFQQRASLDTWLYGIVTHVALNFMRGSQRARTREEAWIAPAVDPSAAAEARVALRELSEWLSLLPPEQRVALVLKEIEGLSAKEVAARSTSRKERSSSGWSGPARPFGRGCAMDELDRKLAGWRQATEGLAPSPEGVANIHGAIDRVTPELPTMQSAGSTVGAGTSKVMWLITSVLIGGVVAGGLFAWFRSRPSPPVASVPAQSPAYGVPVPVPNAPAEEPVGCEPGVTGSPGTSLGQKLMRPLGPENAPGGSVERGRASINRLLSGERTKILEEERLNTIQVLRPEEPTRSVPAAPPASPSAEPAVRAAPTVGAMPNVPAQAPAKRRRPLLPDAPERSRR